MKNNLVRKLMDLHLVEGAYEVGLEVKLKVDQTLTQDATGTMVYLQLLALNPSKIAPECAVAYIDHNLLQTGYENADDHEFIRSVASRFGIIYSKAGNGICHQLHLERFAKPGKLLIGSDSHTPTCGSMGMLAIGAGGLDVAVGLAYGFYQLKVPKVMGVHLKGALKPWVSAKDVILTLLQKLTVKGGVGYILEYFGEGVKRLSVTERATITNMGAELGATTSVFPSDEQTYLFLKSQSRAEDYQPLSADPNATYDAMIELNLSEIEPMVAKPHSPDEVVCVAEIVGTKINQVAIGSCTNSSYKDLMRVAQILKGKQVPRHVSLIVSPGSSTILSMLAKNGALSDLIASGARILESACGPCIGMGQAPMSHGVSLRTFNRNFKGRCGTESASVYLVSPETAAISALTGFITSPEVLKENTGVLSVDEPTLYDIWYGFSSTSDADQEIYMGPNIKPFPMNHELTKDIQGTVVLKTGDNITTDDIVPSGASLLPLRSNIPELSKHCFKSVDTKFYDRAMAVMQKQSLIIVGGENYGQGSSREHAALVPLYLGVKVVLAKSFARIHKANLINSGILPLLIEDSAYQTIEENDHIQIDHKLFLSGTDKFEIYNTTQKNWIKVYFDGSKDDMARIRAGGQINYLKSNH